MDWTQFVLFLVNLAGMFYSIKADARDDRQRACEDRREIVNLMRTSQQENRSVTEAIREDMKLSQQENRSITEAIRQDIKDFHGRLCTLEEKYLQIIVKK